MSNDTNAKEAQMAQWLRSLGGVASTAALPDPDLLWLRAHIATVQAAAARSLWRSALRQVSRCVCVCAALAWLLSDWIATEGADLAAWPEALAAMSSDATVAAAAALGTALVVGGLVLGRGLVARRLRDFGLL
jgi:hypothetical protein